jgi:serine/threonine protein kinase
MPYVPFTHRGPEAHFEPTKPLTFASDVWSLRCLIFEFVGHRSLIDGLWLASQDDMIAQQVQLLGPMPADLWAKWEKRSEWYDEAGNLVNEAAGNCTWDRRFENWVQWLRRRKGMETVGDEEREAFLRMLKCILKWKPEERPTAEEVIKAEWMTRWALPSYEKGPKAQSSLPRTR